MMAALAKDGATSLEANYLYTSDGTTIGMTVDQVTVTRAQSNSASYVILDDLISLEVSDSAVVP